MKDESIINEQLIVDLYTQGLIIKDIRERTSYRPVVISNILKKHGVKFKNRKLTPQEKLDRLTRRDAETGCWVYTGYLINTGYGKIRIDGKDWLAHRLSYTLNIGEIPEGMCILHSCDNPSCINPSHLSIGTHKDNFDDMMAKGRNPKLGKCYVIKVSEEARNQIVSLRSRGFKLREIADRFNISISAVQYHLKTYKG